MSVEKNNWVEIEYEGSFDDGKVFDTNKGKDPLKFRIGSRMVIPGFENAVIGMKEGEEKEVKLTPGEAYGPKNEEVVDLPKSAFASLEGLEEGKELEIMTNMGPMLIEVKKLEEENIKAVLNHPMAGKNLNFKIKLIRVLPEEEAKKEDELFAQRIKDMQEQMAKAQEEHNHEGCDCGDDSCNDESCSCEDKEEKKE
ncbi:MAG: FKBP-type peptidyl-prolyl cis-trans isomerase [Candidatus ainarchaeum sp.]|nr:FKBP-type peptidyl-prolyl cis-trans isomerase [Candidatus ainarchaeum sp.]MDD3976116.1 FKBP-type peptidyl-prolyl cis-trans isomerase [Candidatus ainarchaeum sp.]